MSLVIVSSNQCLGFCRLQVAAFKSQDMNVRLPMEGGVRATERPEIWFNAGTQADQGNETTIDCNRSVFLVELPL